MHVEVVEGRKCRTLALCEAATWNMGACWQERIGAGDNEAFRSCMKIKVQEAAAAAATK
jgi:hypothetical protein